MARQTHTAYAPLGVNDITGVTTPGLASNATDKEEVASARRLLFIAINTGVTGRVVTIDDGASGGTAATATIASGAKRIFGPFSPRQAQRSGTYVNKITFEAAHAEIVWVIINLG